MLSAMPDETGIPICSGTGSQASCGARAGARTARHRHDRHGGAGGSHRAGLTTTDGSRVMLRAREKKTPEEIALLEHAAAIVDAVYEEIFQLLRPGITENQIVAQAQRLLFELGSSRLRRSTRCPVPAATRIRTSSPTVCCARATWLSSTSSTRSWGIAPAITTRPLQRGRGEPGAAGRLQAVPRVGGAGDGPGTPRADHRRDRQGVADRRIARLRECSKSCFGLQFGHGLGVGLYESPMISRLHSFDNPVEIQEGQVFALETIAPPPMASLLRVSRRRFWSPPTVTGSSRSFLPRSFSWREGLRTRRRSRGRRCSWLNHRRRRC